MRDHVALVTGAGRGIGREIARWFAAEGADLVLCARTAESIEAVADEIRASGRRVVAEACDVADAASVDDLVQRALEKFGRIDVAVANAGVLGPVGCISDTQASAWADVLTINVCGTANVVRSVLPAMKDAGRGRILTLSGGGVGGPNIADRVSAYVASKGAVMLLTEALSQEMPDGVTINSIAPGAVPTGFMSEVFKVGREVAGDRLYEAVRSQTMPDLTPLRELVLYLASPESAWLNGRCLSARWDPPARLRDLEPDGIGDSLFRLRRIDEDLYGDLSARRS